jgi:hypothetical protein
MRLFLRAVTSAPDFLSSPNVSGQGRVSYFFEITKRYNLKKKKPKSVFPAIFSEAHPSLT